jgi:hypothetical protein
MCPVLFCQKGKPVFLYSKTYQTTFVEPTQPPTHWLTGYSVCGAIGYSNILRCNVGGVLYLTVRKTTVDRCGDFAWL